MVEAALWKMEGLKAGNHIIGPAIIESDATTFVVPDGFETTIDKHRLFHLKAASEETHHEHDEQRNSASANLLASGQTLKQHRDAIIERTRQRALQRAEKLARDSDPIGYEKLFSKLRGGLVHARETAKKSPPAPSSSRKANSASRCTTPLATAS
jgi:hypothetical protein